MYRIAIISDIHGNIHALNAVLNDLKGKSIDYIYCLGDMIGIGPYSNEVLDELFAIANLKMITGNHDESVLAILNDEAYPNSRINVKPHHEWIAERLEKEHIIGLAKLPRIINETILGQALQFIHYPMNPILYEAPISKDPFDLTGIPSQKNFSVIDGLENISLVCFGHDHDNHQLTCNKTMFYNTGSLGYYKKPFARYGIIDINKTGFKISQQNVPYDLEKFVRELRNTSIPRKEIILRIYT